MYFIRKRKCLSLIDLKANNVKIPTLPTLALISSNLQYTTVFFELCSSRFALLGYTTQP